MEGTKMTYILETTATDVADESKLIDNGWIQ